MKVRIYFEPLTLDIPDDSPIFDREKLSGFVLPEEEDPGPSMEDILIYLEENWATLVDPTEPVIGAIKPLVSLEPKG